MATVISNQPIDPTKGARFSITVSEQLLREDRPKKRQRISVQRNRRPKIAGPSRSTIKPSKDDNSYELAIRSDDKGEYKYNGVQHSSSTVALFYDPVEKSFTLDKLDADFRFTLRSTPGQKDVSDTIENGAGDEDQDGEDLFGGESDDEETTADPNNPYDYRHFLNKGNRSPSPLPSHAASPIPQHTFNSSPALPATSPRARKPPAPAPAPRRPRPKQREHEKPRYLSPKPRQGEFEAADNEDSDPNELVIDMGDSAPITNSRPWRSALNVLNEGGGRGSAPISLRSAASSMSPSLRGGSPSDEEKDLRGAAGASEEEEDDNDDGEQEQEEEEVQSDADADIEEMDLRHDTRDAAPAQPPAEEAVTPGNGWDADDDDELEAELALALEEDQAKSDIEDMVVAAAAGGKEGGDVVGAGGAGGGGESSEESEEE